jgi:hypothetical protein
MDLAAYLGTVVTIAGLALGAMYVLVGQLGKRFDDLRSDFHDLRSDVDVRFTRLERQNETILASVSELGERVTRLEATRG